MAPLTTRKRLLEVSLEAIKGEITTPATDVLVWDLEMAPADEFAERKGSAGYLGHTAPGVVAGTGAGKCTFKTELRGSGTGLDAALAILVQGCGIKKATETYSAVTAHADQKTLSMCCYEDGRKKTLIGCTGEVKIAPEGDIIMCTFDFSGVWQTLADVALPTPSYSTRLPITWSHANRSFTFDSESMKISTFEFSTGNEIVPRMDMGKILYYMIVDRDPTMTLDPEADLIADYDMHAKQAANTELAVSLVMADADDTVTLAIPKFQIREVGVGDREGIRTDEITGQCNGNHIPGEYADAEYSITVT